MLMIQIAADGFKSKEETPSVLLHMSISDAAIEPVSGKLIIN